MCEFVLQYVIVYRVLPCILHVCIHQVKLVEFDDSMNIQKGRPRGAGDHIYIYIHTHIYIFEYESMVI